jgi:hypothetical protein
MDEGGVEVYYFRPFGAFFATPQASPWGIAGT